MIFIEHKELDGKIVVVDIKGELNSETSADFEEYINQLLNKRKEFIILNAQNLEIISSAGIGVILYIQKKMLRTKGSFILCNISEEISVLYEMLGFDKIIKIAGSKEEAVKIMQQQLKLIGSEITERPAIMENAQDPGIAESKKDKQKRKDEPAEERAFENPIILECAQCKSMIRVKKSGNYICPDCKSEFLVEADQTVVF